MFDYQRCYKTNFQVCLGLVAGIILFRIGLSQVPAWASSSNVLRASEQNVKQLQGCSAPAIAISVDRLSQFDSSSAFGSLVQCGELAVQPLISVLNDRRKDSLTRRLAARALGQIGSREAIAALLEVAQQTQSEIRDSAIRALEDTAPGVIFLIAINTPGRAEVSPQNAISFVIEALSHEDVEIRAAAAESLGEMGSMAHVAIPALVRLVEDSDRSVRTEAVHALAQIGSDGIDALLTAMRNEEVSFMHGAIALLQIDDRSIVRSAVERATPSLLEAFHDNSLADDDECVLSELLYYTGQMNARAEILAIREARDQGCVSSLQAGGAELLTEAAISHGIASQPAICRFRVMQQVLWRCRR